MGIWSVDILTLEAKLNLKLTDALDSINLKYKTHNGGGFGESYLNNKKVFDNKMFFNYKTIRKIIPILDDNTKDIDKLVITQDQLVALKNIN